MIFIAGIVGGFIQKAKAGEIFGTLGSTVKNLKFTYLTIITVVMTAKLMTYSGMTADIAKAMVAGTGSLYPLFAPIVGALGAFLTGSGTNSNVLFEMCIRDRTTTKHIMKKCQQNDYDSQRIQEHQHRDCCTDDCFQAKHTEDKRR